LLEDFKKLALSSNFSTKHDVVDWQISEAIRIRLVEQKFLELFSQGLMNGTVHISVGQQFSAVAVTGQLSDDDWVASNHRCHGH
jgi:TPP-dependent pyruvate/acetoin dehydrogenase alpha subunit